MSRRTISWYYERASHNMLYLSRSFSKSNISLRITDQYWYWNMATDISQINDSRLSSKRQLEDGWCLCDCQWIVHYRFIINDENRDSSDPDRMILQWERRSKKNVSAGSSASGQFVLLLIDREARRKSRIATITPDSLEIFVRKSSNLENLQAFFD